METNSSTPPQLNQIMSRPDRIKSGIGMNYVDSYNSSQLAKYNNEYNYWLWQQQMDYNTPVKQVERLKAAGLNPNFNSIDGTGNVNNTPESRANYKTNVADNFYTSMQGGLQIFNGLLNAVGQGIEAVSNISGIPRDIGTYRNLLTANLGTTYQTKQLDKVLKAIEYNKELYSTFGLNASQDIGVVTPTPAPLDRFGNSRLAYDDWMIRTFNSYVSPENFMPFYKASNGLTYFQPNIGDSLFGRTMSSVIDKNVTQSALNEVNSLLSNARTGNLSYQNRLIDSKLLSNSRERELLESRIKNLNLQNSLLYQTLPLKVSGELKHNRLSEFDILYRKWQIKNARRNYQLAPLKVRLQTPNIIMGTPPKFGR